MTSASVAAPDGRALAAAVACYGLWGFMPLLFIAMAANGFGAPEILAHLRKSWVVGQQLRISRWDGSHAPAAPAPKGQFRPHAARPGKPPGKGPGKGPAKPHRKGPPKPHG